MTKKRKLTFIVLLLFITVIFVTFGCSRKSKTEDEGPIDEYTDFMIIDANASDYKIVIPAECGADIKFASQELAYFINESTGVTLPIVADVGYSFNQNDKIFSIGNTTVFQGSGINVSYDELGEDGLKLYTIGSTVIMCGYGDSGSLYAVYEFLNRNFGLEVYAEDEFYINKTDSVRLKKFSVTSVPAFNKRSVGLYCFTKSSILRKRLRQEKFDESYIMWSHSHFQILPKETYYDEHSDWYSPDGTQLCLTNEEMTNEFIRVVIELIKQYPNYNYISLSQEDGATFCTCPKCSQDVAKYTESGVHIRFTNKVAKEIQEYLDKNEPSRIFYISTLAYQRTQYAPVVNANGGYKAIDDSVIPASNVRIMIAPISACYSHSLYDDCNNDTKRIIDGWNAIAKGRLYLWLYNKVFHQYFLPFNNFSSTAENYKILKDLGVEFVYHQGNKETETGALQQLVAYVQSKLMWNPSLNHEQLVSDFIKNYYADAAEHFQEYYDLLRYKYMIWETDLGLHCYPSDSRSDALFDRTFWTRDYLDQIDALFVEMLNDIEHYRTENFELFETLELRIKRERLTVQYLYLSFYFDEFGTAELNAMINEFEEYCAKSKITLFAERFSNSDSTKQISTFISGLRTKLL